MDLKYSFRLFLKVFSFLLCFSSLLLAEDYPDYIVYLKNGQKIKGKIYWFNLTHLCEYKYGKILWKQPGSSKNLLPVTLGPGQTFYIKERDIDYIVELSKKTGSRSSSTSQPKTTDLGKIYIAEPKKLFSLDTSFIQDLDKGEKISTSLLSVFRKKDYPLSSHSRIKVRQKGNEWQIQDPQSGVSYTIRKDNDYSIGVYSTSKRKLQNGTYTLTLIGEKMKTSEAGRTQIEEKFTLNKWSDEEYEFEKITKTYNFQEISQVDEEGNISKTIQKKLSSVITASISFGFELSLQGFTYEIRKSDLYRTLEGEVLPDSKTTQLYLHLRMTEKYKDFEEKVTQYEDESGRILRRRRMVPVVKTRKKKYKILWKNHYLIKDVVFFKFLIDNKVDLSTFERYIVFDPLQLSWIRMTFELDYSTVIKTVSNLDRALVKARASIIYAPNTVYTYHALAEASYLKSLDPSISKEERQKLHKEALAALVQIIGRTSSEKKIQGIRPSSRQYAIDYNRISVNDPPTKFKLPKNLDKILFALQKYTHMRAKDPQKALKLLQQTLSLNQKFALLQLALGEAYHLNGKFQKALHHYQIAFQLNRRIRFLPQYIKAAKMKRLLHIPKFRVSDDLLKAFQLLREYISLRNQKDKEDFQFVNTKYDRVRCSLRYLRRKRTTRIFLWLRKGDFLEPTKKIVGIYDLEKKLRLVEQALFQKAQKVREARSKMEKTKPAQ
ncbi:MAG: tetratricopeptide repeat protein [Planctomycetota bacterium]|nr:MAG: tetratricopeptide repeat protein [Planctomycetota bacterium]